MADLPTTDYETVALEFPASAQREFPLAGPIATGKSRGGGVGLRNRRAG